MSEVIHKSSAVQSRPHHEAESNENTLLDAGRSVQSGEESLPVAGRHRLGGGAIAGGAPTDERLAPLGISGPRVG